MILLFLDQTEVAKIGVDFYAFLLKRRGISALIRASKLGKKERFLAKWIALKNLKNCFDALYREVYLTFKERIAYRKIQCGAALAKLHQHAQYRRNRALMKVFGKWKAQGNTRMVASDARLVAMVFSSWRVVASEAKLVKMYVPQSPPKSYREMRALTPPGDSENGTIGNDARKGASYRDRRSRQ